MCGAVAPSCGPAPCVLRSQVDLRDPTRQTSLRPALVVGENCQPHALLLADLHEPWTFIPFYTTTRDGVQWIGEISADPVSCRADDVTLPAAFSTTEAGRG